MKKYLFSLMVVMVFTVLFGWRDALSQSCGSPDPNLNCKGGGPFYGFMHQINCWISMLESGHCGASPIGTYWFFIDIETENPHLVWLDEVE